MPRHTAISRELVAEVPVAVVFDGSTAAVMLASPSHIHDFALGFALTEGFITSPADVSGFEEVTHEHGIEARIWLKHDRSVMVAARRRSMVGPVGCGLCGVESLEQAARSVPLVESRASALTFNDLNTATELLRRHQPMHDRTHAVHGAGFLRPGAGIVTAREDVGRHNALDKLVGALVRRSADPAEGAVVMTSRISVELVQKCAFARCPILIAVSAPTAYAVQVAERAGITLAAFSRGHGFDVFSHPDRLSPWINH
ncbi:MAG: formate dehydrogenase accessory sulfurtransferase FdhD [Pseudomonadota bacterium]